VRNGAVFAFGILDEVLGKTTTCTEWLFQARAGNDPVLGHGLVAIWLLIKDGSVNCACG
jgi:hypothetical protein